MLYICLIPTGVTLLLFAFVLWTYARRRKGGQHAFTLLGASLVLLSMSIVPWLNLQPLKHLGLAWFYEGLPAWEWLVHRLGIGWLGRALEKLSGLETLFEPPGWLALVLVGRLGVWLWVLFWGIAAVILSWSVGLGKGRPWVGYGLALSSSLLLLTVGYHLPTIDGLGERAFPHIASLAVPVLGAELEWAGPLVMMAGLLLMLYGGLAQTIDSDFQRQSLESNEQ